MKSVHSRRAQKRKQRAAMSVIDDRVRARIRQWRRASRMPQAKLAKAAGWKSQPTYSKYELGDIDASLDQIDRMATLLGYSLVEAVRPDAGEAPPFAEVVGLLNALSDEQRTHVLAVVRGMAQLARPSGDERRSVRRSIAAREPKPVKS